MNSQRSTGNPVNSNMNLDKRRLDSHLIRDLMNYIKTRIVAGDGIMLSTMGDQIVISKRKEIIPSISSAARDVPIVAVLPSVPTSGYKEVLWGDSSKISGGTGDNQVWSAFAGQTEWYPDQGIYTTKSGQVV